MAAFIGIATSIERDDSRGVYIEESSEALAKKILSDVLLFRRTTRSQTTCAQSPCEHCMKPHFPKVVSAISRGEPIPFVLPAFPGKSPNLAKVLGPLPDMAERRALEFLQSLCDRIQEYYAPGVRMIICSDGRVFSDAVGMRDDDVTAYRQELAQMIQDFDLNSISTFNLEELYDDLSFDEMRERLMNEYGAPMEALKSSVSRGSRDPNCSEDDREAHRLYCGITRFLFEDATYPGQTISRTAIQKDARQRAYHVIQKSMAWSELIEDQFPEAVRLSIHPQGCGAKKMGIRLLEPDHWQTPWHGVAVDLGGRFVLVKRSQAEEMGAELIQESGRSSHYVLSDTAAISKLLGAEYEL